MNKEPSKHWPWMVIRWGSLGCGLIIAALYLNSSFYSAWVSGGPPNDYPEAWAHRGLMHLCFSGACVLGAIVLFRVIGSYPRIGGVTVTLVVVGLLLSSIPYIRAFLDSDSCLDSGGRWNDAEYRCER